MKTPRFSIVIPTREREGTLKYCLQTCLDQQQFDDYEIIISDNNSSPATRELVDSFNNSKIKYFSTGRTLAMYENFEFAVSKATGEYVIVLGDDDGITLKGLYNIDQIIKKTNHKAIAWHWIMYYWPEGVPLGYENTMYIPVSNNVRVINGKEEIKAVIGFKTTYNYLPMLYINGAIHRDLIKELKSRTGRIFGSITPDSYSGMCMAYLSEYFLFVDRPLTIAGISGKSNGNNQLFKKPDNAINNEFNQLNDLSQIQFHKSIPNVRSINAIVSDVFMQAKEKLFRDDADLVLDRKLMVSKVLEDIVVFDNQDWESNRTTIKNALNEKGDSVDWFEKLIAQYKPRFKDPNYKEKIVTGLHHTTLIINGDDFACKTVYDVAQFYSKSIESEIHIPANVSRQDVVSQPPASFLKKILRRLRLIGRIAIKGS